VRPTVPAEFLLRRVPCAAMALKNLTARELTARRN